MNTAKRWCAGWYGVDAALKLYLCISWQDWETSYFIRVPGFERETDEAEIGQAQQRGFLATAKRQSPQTATADRGNPAGGSSVLSDSREFRILDAIAGESPAQSPDPIASITESANLEVPELPPTSRVSFSLVRYTFSRAAVILPEASCSPR
jgi:hypothetical protein